MTSESDVKPEVFQKNKKKNQKNKKCQKAGTRKSCPRESKTIKLKVMRMRLET